LSRTASSLRAGLLATGVTPRHLELEGGPLVIERAEGVFVRDEKGRDYLDAFAGYWTASIGYGRKRVAEAVGRQLETMNYAPLDWRAHRPALALAEELLKRTPGMARVFLCSGGSEAVDTALKLARLWGGLQRPRRETLLFREGSYHGASLGAASVTGFDSLRTPFEPLLAGTRKIDDPLSEDAVAAAIEDEGAHGLALIAEPVRAAGRVEVPSEGYWPRVSRALEAAGDLLISDEVLTGVGRTGRWLAGPEFGLKPDMIVLAKGLSGGYAPMGAVLISERVASAFENEPLEHGYTYGGHPAGCVASLETLKIIEEENLYENARLQGVRLRAGLERVASRFEGFGPVSGLGLLYSIGHPVEGEEKTSLRASLQEAGLLAYVEEGALGIAPALSVSSAEIDELLVRLENGLERFLGA
jgi:adenosylmethionine-8-amino-7-oxononanoate aminotransferase